MARFSRLLLNLVLAGALVVIAVNTWFAVDAVQSLVRSQNWLSHTWQVIGQLEHLFGSVRDAETSARGFVITGDESYLQPSRDARVAIPKELDDLQALTMDNPTQQVNLAEARVAVERRIAILDQTIVARSKDGFESAQAIVLTGSGKTEMDSLRASVERMESEEHRLLLLREEDARRAGTRALWTIALASLLDFVMVVLISRYLTRERKLRLAAEVVSQRLAVSRAELEKSSNEVRTLNAQLEQRVRERTVELETTNRELEAFSYSVSHDLRAPLRTIDGFSLALQEDYAEAVDETGRDYINRVRAGVQRMGGLIDALLQLSRITRAELSREDCNLSTIAATVAAALKEENPERQMEFSIEDGQTANADPKLVQVALENLMGNAVKFTGRLDVPAQIAFGWDAAQDAWFVRDNGAGFDMNYAGKLFNAFNRLHGDKDFKGSGIGLATVARVIRRHGGRIWAESAVGHGATFWFTLG